MTQFAYPVPKHRARIAIMHSICEFSLHRGWTGFEDRQFFHAHDGETAPQVGDLVALQSAPPSKFYLSWVLEVTPAAPSSFARYALESIEDGEVCNWTNVGLLIFNRKTRSASPDWRWSDKQFEFYDRWRRVCFKEKGAYSCLPLQPDFDGDRVTLGFRYRFGFKDARPSRSFADWRKVTLAVMCACYDECNAEMEAAPYPEKDAPTIAVDIVT